MNATTERQLEVLRAIRAYQLKKGFPISIRELDAELGIRSTNAVSEHLHRLTKKGFLKLQPRQPRTLLLTDKGQREIAP